LLYSFILVVIGVEAQADKMARTRDEMDKVACTIAKAKADEELAQLNQKRAVLAAKETEERVQKFLAEATKAGKAGELQKLDGLKAAVKYTQKAAG
jgi:hypothetical protein